MGRGLGSVDCPLHTPMKRLLYQHRTELMSLKIDKDIQLELDFGTEKGPYFRRLEELDISESFPTDDFHEEDSVELKKLVSMVIKNAPNLERIVAENVETVAMFVPKEKHQLVVPSEKFTFWLARGNVINPIRNVSQRDSRLQKLTIDEPFSITPGGILGSGAGEPVNDNLRLEFDTALQQMLQTCHQTITAVSIWGAYSLANLSFPPLIRLTRLKICKDRPGHLDQIWSAIESIDFDRVMPNLKKIKIYVETSHLDGDGDRPQTWPMGGDMSNVPRYYSKSVRKLVLKVELRRVNLFQLQAVFPNVSVLKLSVCGNDRFGAELAQFSDIWKYWPDLHSLKIDGIMISIGRNFDADFCGIHEEEAEWLRQQSTKYLKKVHIVPIMPCLLTMKSKKLCQLSFDSSAALSLIPWSLQSYAVCSLIRTP